MSDGGILGIILLITDLNLKAQLSTMSLLLLAYALLALCKSMTAP